MSAITRLPHVLPFLVLFGLLAACGSGGVPETDANPPHLSLDMNWPSVLRYQCDSDGPCPPLPELGASVSQEDVITVPAETWNQANAKELIVTVVASDPGGISEVGLRLVFDVDIVEVTGGEVVDGGPANTLVIRRGAADDVLDVMTVQVVLRIQRGDGLFVEPWARDYGGLSGSPNSAYLGAVGVQVENN